MLPRELNHVGGKLGFERQQNKPARADKRFPGAAQDDGFSSVLAVQDDLSASAVEFGLLHPVDPKGSFGHSPSTGPGETLNEQCEGRVPELGEWGCGV